MITRKNPVVLKVFKLTNGTTAVPGRTQPLFIQETLNLSQGKIFKFDIDKWKDVISSGLFQNLTVNSVHTEEGVYLNITGFETPSLSLSPEATFTASLDNPEILGGVSWKDSNFLGMGDNIALSIFKKESLEEGMQHSEPTLKLKWTEAGIGKKSKISVSHEEDNSFEYFSEVFSRPFYSLYSQLKDNNKINIYHDRNNVRLSTTIAELSTIIPPEHLEKYSIGRSLSSVRYGLQPFIRTVASLSRSYKEGTGSASDEGVTATGDSCRGIGGQQLVSRAIGGRKFLECGFKNGATLRSWYEGGSVVSRPASASSGRFHQVGLAVNLPTLTLSWLRNISSTRKTIPTSTRDENAQRSGFNHSGDPPDKNIGNKRHIKQAMNSLPSTTAAAINQPTTTMLSAWRNKLYPGYGAFQSAELVGKVKLHGISSWGSGCVPAQHQASLSSPQLVRCLPSHLDYSSSAVSKSGSSSSGSSNEGNERGLPTIATTTGEMGNEGILKRAQSIFSIQRDVYVKGLLPAAGIVGVFADTGLFQRPVECIADSAGIIGAGGQRIESFLTAGVSLRVLGFRVDYGAQILHKKKKMAIPQVHFGFDLGD